MQHHLTTWAGAILVALILGSAHLLDGPSELQAAIDSAQAKTDATVQATQRKRMDQRAQAACGENAAFQFVDATTVQCFTKRARKTFKAAL